MIAGAVLGLFFFRYWRAQARTAAEALAAADRGALSSEGPKAQHPKIAMDSCIGCGSCVTVCPEGDVLALINGKAAIVNGHKCIGHGLCAEACPVGAITMVMAKPSAGSDLPVINEEYETSVENLFIAGESDAALPAQRSRAESHADRRAGIPRVYCRFRAGGASADAAHFPFFPG